MLVSIVFGVFLLLVILSIVAICCGCRARQRRKRHERSSKYQYEFLFVNKGQIQYFWGAVLVKKLPIVYDAHYSINELVKDVGCVTTSSRTCNTSINDGDQLSLRMEQSKIEPTGEKKFFVHDWIFFFENLSMSRSFINLPIQSFSSEKINGQSIQWIINE